MDGSSIKQDIFAQRVPRCPRCEEKKEARRVGERKKKVKVSAGEQAWKEDESGEEEEGEHDLPGWGVLKVSLSPFLRR